MFASYDIIFRSRNSHCACHALTVEAGKSVKSSPKGYHFRRLEEPVTAGVYECNATCACAATCLNRVAQRPLRNKLQVLKVEKTHNLQLQHFATGVQDRIKGVGHKDLG